jgi:hypothetical protein
MYAVQRTGLSRVALLKSMIRYLRLFPPPRPRTVILPCQHPEHAVKANDFSVPCAFLLRKAFGEKMINFHVIDRVDLHRQMGKSTWLLRPPVLDKP